MFGELVRASHLRYILHAITIMPFAGKSAWSKFAG